jgi:hypothetical protein
VRFFLGDSASYMHTAATGWIPPDRSFLYGMLIGGTAGAAHSLYALVLAQTLFGVILACLLFRLLRDSFAAPRAIAGLCAVVLALEPSQLFYERMLMAESAGTLAFATMLYAGFAWLRQPRWYWPLAWALAGILAVALRMSLLPVVLGFAVLPVAVAALVRPANLPWQKLVAHGLLAILASALLHKGYQQLYGRLSGTRPDYIANSGYFRLGLVAPLITREEVLRAGLPADLLDSVTIPLAEPRAREAQIWMDGGLIAQIHKHAGEQGNRAARKLASSALRGDPAGFLRLARLTVADYFDAGVVHARMEDDLGTRPLEQGTLDELRACCDHDASGVEKTRNPIARYFSASTVWLTFCFLALPPLALATLIAQWRHARAAALLLATSAAGLALAEALFSHIVSFRYLHPFPFLLLVTSGALLAALGRLRAPRGDDGISTSASSGN